MPLGARAHGIARRTRDEPVCFIHEGGSTLACHSSRHGEAGPRCREHFNVSGYKAWNAPDHTEHLLTKSCLLNPELGQSHRWLAVTHRHDPPGASRNSNGLWLYYARGCSGVFWNAGRTLVARDRLHAVVKLYSLRRGGCNAACAAAACRLEITKRWVQFGKYYFGERRAEWPDRAAALDAFYGACNESATFLHIEQTASLGGAASKRNLSDSPTPLHRNTQLVRLVLPSPSPQSPLPPLPPPLPRPLQAQPGATVTTGAAPYISAISPSRWWCPPSAESAAHPKAPQGFRMMLQSAAFFDPLLLSLLRSQGYDSATLLFQPKGGANPFLKWTTELLDARDARAARLIEQSLFLDLRSRSNRSRPDSHAHARSVNSTTPISRHLRGCDGQACVPTPTFLACMECAGCAGGCAAPVVRRAS